MKLTLSTGTHNLRLEVGAGFSTPDPLYGASASFTLASAIGRIDYSNYGHEWGKNGFRTMLGTDKIFQVLFDKVLGNFQMTFKGESDMPGVLLAGEIYSTGGFEHTWGRKSIHLYLPLETLQDFIQYIIR